MYHINDAIAANVNADDIDDQGTFIVTNTNTNQEINRDNNYVYDEEGRLIQDKQEGIENIVWRVDGKIKEIQRTTANTRQRISFDYDAMGHRVAKHTYNNASNLLEKSTYYVLDAQGNVMNVYEHEVQPQGGAATFSLAEKHIYGAARLGMETTKINLLENVAVSYQNTHLQGLKNYEINNHLGNVLSVIMDKAMPRDLNSDQLVDERQVYILTATDYSPFGVQLNERNFKLQFCTEETNTTNNVVLNNTFTGLLNLEGYYPASITASLLTNVLGNELRVGAILPTGTLGCRKNFTIPSNGTNFVLSFDYNKGNLAVPVTCIIRNAANTVVFTQNLSATGNYSFNLANLPAGNYVLSFERTGSIATRYFTIDNVKLTYDTQTTVTNCLVKDYRYGFNGMEADNEISGEGNSYTAEFWQYSPRIGRRWNIDPVLKVHESPYATFANNPIWFRDPNGADTTLDSKSRELITDFLNKDSKNYNEGFATNFQKLVDDQSTVYNFSQWDSAKKTDKGTTFGQLSASGKNEAGQNLINIEYSLETTSQGHKLDALFEEFDHAGQFLDKRIGFAENEDKSWGVIGYDYYDEVDNKIAPVKYISSFKEGSVYKTQLFGSNAKILKANFSRASGERVVNLSYTFDDKKEYNVFESLSIGTGGAYSSEQYKEFFKSGARWPNILIGGK